MSSPKFPLSNGFGGSQYACEQMTHAYRCDVT